MWILTSGTVRKLMLTYSDQASATQTYASNYVHNNEYFRISFDSIIKLYNIFFLYIVAYRTTLGDRPPSSLLRFSKFSHTGLKVRRVRVLSE